MNNRKFINIIGNILVIISFAFIIHKIIAYQIDFGKLFSISTLIMIAISIIIYALLVLFYANIFNKILSLLSDIETSKTDTVFTYSQANLYKYLPGNIFHYIGRNQIAVNQAASHGTVIATTIAEMLLIIFAAIITVVIFAGQDALKWLLSNGLFARVIFVLAVIFLCCLIASVILYSANERIKERIEKYRRIANRIGFVNVVKFIIAYIIIFILNSVMFLTLLYSIGGELHINLLASVIGMYTLSWIIGFVTPGAPAGLGIREVIMTSLLTGIVSGDLVITAVVLYRVVTTLGDVGGFLMAYQLKKLVFVTNTDS